MYVKYTAVIYQKFLVIITHVYILLMARLRIKRKMERAVSVMRINPSHYRRAVLIVRSNFLDFVYISKLFRQKESSESAAQ